MNNYKFNPVNQVIVNLDACAPALVSLYRCDDSKPTFVTMTNHLLQLIRTAMERGQLIIDDCKILATHDYWNHYDKYQSYLKKAAGFIKTTYHIGE